MSGTSLDGIDVAIVDIGKVDKVGRKILPVAFHSTPYPEAVRQAILGVSNTTVTTAEIARLHVRLGQLYARAVEQTCKRHRVPLRSIELVGCHGQTIYHQGEPRPFLGRPVAATLQIGEAGVIAEALGVPVVSDFRMRDMAAAYDEGAGQAAHEVSGRQQIAALKGDLSLLGREPHTDRSVNRMLERFLQQPHVRTSEPVVIVAGQHGCAVDVRTA
jgi:1,6-anhydro-N-acetylmuramate kinase